MSHDFAKEPKTKKRSPATKKPIPKKSKAKTQKPPLLMWFIAIVSSVALIIGLILLTKFAPRTQTPVTEQNTEQQTTFDFFTLLPETTLEIEAPSNSDQTIYFEYYLQAGSFKRLTDAESRRAELGLLGYESHISEITHNGNQWHRVQIGPIDTRSKLAATRGQLLESGYDTLVIKREIPQE